ncbi:hypothetical protein RchiOBHm_Chr1g0382811 [Rosa chinensis]|uniref:Uncharacterized protein n=1 Tax=Rosa chinensis TaxID=74649 RepID=A0A2P6SPH7_ROSCH|nr:hypothetical protein RchiOBHm_Chr1g0382811 [Rosa chinensis]
MFSSDTIHKPMCFIKNDKEKQKVACQIASSSSPVAANSEYGEKQQQLLESKSMMPLPRFAPEIDGVHCFETIVLH